MSTDRIERYRAVADLDLSLCLLEAEGEQVAAVPWDSGGPVNGTVTVWAFRGCFVMWEDWSDMGMISAEGTLLDALVDLDFFQVTGAETSLWAEIDTDELIRLLRPHEAAEGVFTLPVNGVDVEVDAEAGTVRRVDGS